MKKVIVTNSMVGICGMQVCAGTDATDEEILSVCNRENPSGTSNGWSRVLRANDESPLFKNCGPVQCADDPARQHLIIVC
jgi:hypothetical protein